MRGPDPRGAVRGEPARRHQQMDVRVVVERPRPRVEHGEDAGRAADPRAILGDRQHTGGGLAQEGGVDRALVATRDRPELGRQREGEGQWRLRHEW